MSRRSALDDLFMERAIELAQRGLGSTIPNPAVGAVIVRGSEIIGEGYHHVAGGPHAEVNALRETSNPRGATAYVTLEPCNHTGRTAPCTQALIAAGVERVVIGAMDPNPKTNGGGVSALRAAGIQVDVLNDRRAERIIETFSFAIREDRPFVSLKMAMSLDGRISSEQNVRQQLTDEPWRLYVRDLRIAHDAVMVGAGTVRVDNPLLTVRPASRRLRPFKRIVACETDTVPSDSRIFERVDGYEPTIVLAPGGVRDRFANLNGVADVLFVGTEDETDLDLRKAMTVLRERGVQSVLCEGGPTAGARMIAAGVVDRFYFAVAPIVLASPNAVPVLAPIDLATLAPGLRFDGMEMVGRDVVLTGLFDV